LPGPNPFSITKGRLNRPAFWFIITIFLGLRIALAVYSSLRDNPDVLSHQSYLLVVVAGALGRRMRDFGWSALWAWAAMAIITIAVPVAVASSFGAATETAPEALALIGAFSTLPLILLVVLVGIRRGDAGRNKFGEPSVDDFGVTAWIDRVTASAAWKPMLIFTRRINRKVYWSALSVILVAIALAVYHVAHTKDDHPLLIFFLLLCCTAVVASARSRDFGWSGRWAWIAIIGCGVVAPLIVAEFLGNSNQMVQHGLFYYLGLPVPFAMVVLTIIGVGIPRGQDGDNRFGRPFPWAQIPQAAEE
jgi:uncharacterized membrane protein YhaH (DUF805 family)